MKICLASVVWGCMILKHNIRQRAIYQNQFKQVFASTWNFRAFHERSFYRIDHLSTAMGVLCHLNFTEEKVNGV